jgi:hypothetical protein
VQMSITLIGLCLLAFVVGMALHEVMTGRPQ